MNKNNIQVVKEKFALALENHQNNNLIVAKNLYNKILKINPNYIDAINNLGLVFQGLGELQKAINCYEKAIKIDPNYIHSQFNLGNTLNSLKEYQKSISCYERAIEIDPNFKDAINNLGVAFKELGEYQKSISCYERAIEIDPNFKDAINNLGVAFKELGEYQKSISCYERAIEIDFNYASAHFNRGVLLYEIGQYENAIKDLELIDFKNSNSYLLDCFFKLDKRTIFYDLLNTKIKKNNNIDALIGSCCSRSEIRYGINIPNPFCKDPLNYVLSKDLTKICNFDSIFIETVKNILDQDKIALKNQSLLTNGIQTSGNFFNHEVKLTNKIKNIIHSEIKNYKINFTDSEEGFLKNFPHKYSINAWLVSMKSGGKLDAHMHENGWLSGSIYINVPRKKKIDSGNLVVCIEEEYEKEENKSIKKSINVVTGSICLFPASLLHYTVPFESKEERIVLAFDVIAKN